MDSTLRRTRRVTTFLATCSAAATLVVAPAHAAPESTSQRSSVAAEAAAPYRITPFRVRASDPLQLKRNWRRWQNRDLAAYTSSVSFSCECLPRPPVLTRVRGSRVVSVRYEGQTRQLERHGYEMEALYRLLRRGYAEADDVRVTYRSGVPVSLVIDWDSGVADEETIMNVQVRHIVA